MSPEHTDALLACRDCQVLYPVVGTAAADGNAASGEDFDGQQQFTESHVAHRLARFYRHGADSRADRPLWDPMATITFEVTDGHERYVATSTRRSVDAPREYRFARGTLEVRNAEVVIDDGDLRRGLDLRFYPHAVRPTKVDRFIAVLREIVCGIEPDNLDIAFDDADDPAVSIARMPDTVFHALLTRCADIFDSWEMLQVGAFLHENREEDGLLALRVRRECHVRTAA
jgi:hypothetical protein